MLWGSVVALFPSIISDIFKYFILPRMGEVTTVQATIRRLILSLVGGLAYLAFSIGFLMLIMKIIKKPNEALEPTSFNAG
jgi:hypothetical protein